MSNVNAVNLLELVTTWGACQKGRSWLKSLPPQTDIDWILSNLPSPSWFNWLESRVTSHLNSSAWETYKAVRRSAWGTYEAVERSALETYGTAIRPARETYEAVRRSAWETYEAAVRPALETYEAVRRSALETYEAVRRSALKLALETLII